MLKYCKMEFIPVIEGEFSASFLQSCVTWSSEIIIICWFDAQETFMIIINVEYHFYAKTMICYIQMFVSLGELKRL